jgi:hypothetical protein
VAQRQNDTAAAVRSLRVAARLAPTPQLDAILTGLEGEMRR